MPFIHQGIKYRSKKHPMLASLFFGFTDGGTVGIGQNHAFTLGDVARAYEVLAIPEPASISNTILDLTRQDRGIEARLPDSIRNLGYDLRKKTGPAPNGENYAGEFVFVGIGNTLDSWLRWSSNPNLITITNSVPYDIIDVLYRDEGALFSVIDYCDVFSYVFFGQSGTVLRVQNPLKWQPNEIDGLYFSNIETQTILYVVEAKALSTGDDINLEQCYGAYQTALARFPNRTIVPVAVQMRPFGMDIGTLAEAEGRLELVTHWQVKIDPPIPVWQSRRNR